MKNFRIYFTVIIIALFSFTFASSSFAINTVNISDTSISKISNVSPIDVYSPACILIESSTGKILYEKNSNEVRYPASTTKIMTAILVLENCKLTDKATVSLNAINSIPPDYVVCNIVAGEQFTVEQLLNVLLIPSANDAAIVLAEHVAGSVDKFSYLMNEKAKEIGCQNTHFVNPNGIHNDNHVSTAYDLALIAQYAMKNDTFRKIVNKTEYTLPATTKHPKADRTFTTTNQLLVTGTYYYPNAIGIKTGYTGDAGNCLVSSAKKDNLELISVVLGADITKDGLSEKFLDSIHLLDYGFENYSMKVVQKANSVFDEVKVSWATKETKNLKVLVKDEIEIFLPNSLNLDDLNPEITLDKLKAPISAGNTIGKITYTVDGVTHSSDLIAQNDVVSYPLLPILLRIILIIVTLYLLFLLLKPKRNNKNKLSKKNKDSKSDDTSSDSKKGGIFRYTTMSKL